jgi:uncharacterized protein YdhG (YjbR/CyaY superfamily)
MKTTAPKTMSDYISAAPKPAQKKLREMRAEIQFPLEKPLPLLLVRKMTALRVGESIEKDGKWRSR